MTEAAAQLDIPRELASLRPAAGAQQRDLDEALRDVREALAGGQELPPLDTAVAGSIAARAPRVAQMAQSAFSGSEVSPIPARLAAGAATAIAPTSLVNVRLAPVREVDPLAPAWTRGIRPSASRGPFQSELGEWFWIDTYTLPRLLTVMEATSRGSRVLARLPIRGLAPIEDRALAAGSGWLAASLLVPGRPASEFVGVRIAGGHMRLAGITSTADGSVTVGGEWRLVVELRLERGPDPAPSDGAGADASHARVALPATVSVTATASGDTAVALERSTADAYGTSLELAQSAGRAFYDELSRFIVVPCTPSRREFRFDRVRSETFQLAGAAPITRAGWGVAVTTSVPAALGEAAGVGAAWLDLGRGIRARWAGISRDAALQRSVLTLAPASLAIVAQVVPGEATTTLRLWKAPTADGRQSSIDVRSAPGTTVVLDSLPGSDVVLVGGTAAAHLDRPVQVDGGRVATRMPIAWMLLVDGTQGGAGALVLGFDPSAASAAHIALSLENAVLKVRKPRVLVTFGSRAADELKSGLLITPFALRAFLPTLPDPYAANFEFDRTRDVDSGWSTAVVAWPNPDTPGLGFYVQDPANLARATRAARVMLDVSSNADQFGVMIPTTAAVGVAGLSAVARADEVMVVTLPPISWEPMLTLPPDPVSGDLPLQPPPDDGGPATLQVEAPVVRPVAPLALLATYGDGIAERRHFRARLPLPFGLVAQIDTHTELPPRPESVFTTTGGAVFFNEPRFPGPLAGGRQLALRGPPSAGDDPTPPAKFQDTPWPGGVDMGGDYAKSVLGSNIFTQFDLQFGSTQAASSIPVRRYDLSGYGATMLSDWRDVGEDGPAIVQARFDVLVGRTAHEVVQMQSVLYPWYVRVTRTITIDRTPGGWLLRKDTGWVALGDGAFDYREADFPSARRHPGAVARIERVRNIRFNGPQFEVVARGEPGIIGWQPVRFDADVVFAAGGSPRLAMAGGTAGGRTPTSSTSGWIQIGGPTRTEVLGNGATMARVRPVNALEVLDLLSSQGPASAPVSCLLALGGTASEPGLTLRAARVDVQCNDDPAAPHLVTAVRGSPALPRDGAWSMARITDPNQEPSALDRAFPIPVVKPNALDGADRWHLAEPADITRLADTASPKLPYGLVQSLGAQKVFFGRPRVGDDPQPISLPRPPQLADMAALLHAAGIFPGLTDAFEFKNLKSLSVQGGDVSFKETFTIPAGTKAVLADMGGPDALQVVIEYHNENGDLTSATVEVSPAASPRWHLSLARVCFAVMFKGSKLISIYAAVSADEHSAPTVKDLCVHYESFLDVLQTIFSNVQQVARFLPGGADAGLKVSFQQGRLSVNNSFALPALPLGPGEITDVAVEMGFDVTLTPFDLRFVAGIGSSSRPFRWVVSPLAGTSVVQVGVGTQGLDVLVQGGLGVGLAIDLGIAAGSASIALALELNTGPSPFELRGILSGRASVDVLQGLASATITLAAGLGVIPPPELLKPPFLPPQLLPPPDSIPSLTIGLTASVSVGVHISVCWVVDVDWDGYWQFRQDIKTPEIPIPI